MPIIIKDFEWSESEAKLDIIVPQKGIRSAKIDIMVTPLYVKVRNNLLHFTFFKLSKFIPSSYHQFLIRI